MNTLESMDLAAILDQTKVPADRRAHPRVAAWGMALVRRTSPPGELARLVRIKNISKSGIAFTGRQQYTSGEILLFAPIGGEHPCTLALKIIHGRRSRDQWLHGAEFLDGFCWSRLWHWTSQTGQRHS